MRENCNRENEPYCYFHPKEQLVGVCPLCLNERLLLLAAKQGLTNRSKNSLSFTASNKHPYINVIKSKPSALVSTGLPKIFALGSLRHRQFRRRKSDHHHDHFADVADDLDTTSTSLEDESFISIKFGENGMASWEKTTTNKTVSKVTLEQCSMSWGTSQSLVKDNFKNNDKGNIGNYHTTTMSVVEHAKPRATPVMRWRKRICQLLQVIRGRRTSKGNEGGGGEGGERGKKGEGMMKVGRNESNDKGWMRSLKMTTK